MTNSLLEIAAAHPPPEMRTLEVDPSSLLP